MDEQKAFAAVTSVEEQNRVNDAQKARYASMVLDNPQLVEQRRAAYLVRWREALVHVAHGSTVLDIGAGWPIARIWDEIIRDYRIAYHLLDIDPAIVANARTMLAEYGLPASNAQIGMNTELPFRDATFDVVFSSHCLEHSSDLPRTFGEIARVLKPGGKLIFAVPFGFDDSDEHLFCLDIDGWLAATELAGFDILTVHLGHAYVASGDLFVVATRQAADVNLPALASLTSRYSKVGKTFVPAASAIFDYHGDVVESGAHRILASAGATATISASRPIGAVLMFRHRWSSITEFKAGHETQTCDLYSRVPYIQTIAIDSLASKVEIRVIGSSRGTAQAVIHGVMLEQ